MASRRETCKQEKSEAIFKVPKRKKKLRILCLAKFSFKSEEIISQTKTEGIGHQLMCLARNVRNFSEEGEESDWKGWRSFPRGGGKRLLSPDLTHFFCHRGTVAKSIRFRKTRALSLPAQPSRRAPPSNSDRNRNGSRAGSGEVVRPTPDVKRGGPRLILAWGSAHRHISGANPAQPGIF